MGRYWTLLYYGQYGFLNYKVGDAFSFRITAVTKYGVTSEERVAFVTVKYSKQENAMWRFISLMLTATDAFFDNELAFSPCIF